MRALGLLSMLMVVAPAIAAKLEIKGLALGASQRDVVAQLEGLRCPVLTPPKPIDDCTYDRKDVWQQNVTPLNTLANELVDRWELHFARGRLGEVKILLPHSSFRTVRHTLEEKYGQPAVREKEALQNCLGATFPGLVESWRDSSGTLTAHEFAGSLDTSAVTLIAPWFMEAARAASKRQAKQRAGDL